MIVLPTDPTAAEYRTDIEGWVSRRGAFFGPGDGGETAARYHGCTHVTCSRCGEGCSKGGAMCRKCLSDWAAEDYAKMPQRAWDGEAPLYSDAMDRYYSSIEEAEDDMAPGQSLDDLRLIICEPVYAKLSADYFSDEIAEDGDYPDELLDAVDEFNRRMATCILSWRPGDYAVARGENK